MSVPTPPPVPAGWYPDPQGRFARRYFDGLSWTAMVQEHSGSTGPEGQAPAHASGTYPSAIPPTWEPARPSGGGAPTGVLVVAFGLVQVALSLFVLDWVEFQAGGSGVSFLWLAERAFSGHTYYVDIGDFAQAYLAFLGLALAVVVALSALVGTWPDRSGTGTRRYPQRSIAALLALTAGLAQIYVLTAFAEFDLVEELKAGGWIGIIGYAFVLVGSLRGPY